MMFPAYITIDFESFYTDEYSLRKMTTPEYILSPLFRSFGASISLGDTGKAVYLEHEELVIFIEGLKKAQAKKKPIIMISHNALFDMCVLAWRYGLIPDLMIDTLGMCRVLLSRYLRSLSLESVTKFLGVTQKGKFLAKTKGMYPEEMKRLGLWEGFKEYAIDDNYGCRDVFMKLRAGFPNSEYEVMHNVLMCAVKPQFILDRNMLAQHAAHVDQEKANLLTNCGLLSRDELMSNEKFAELLRQFGIEPGTKISPKTGLESYAFAKTDQFMLDLEEDDDPSVQALAAARVGHKSTLEETRTRRFINISNIDADQYAYPGMYPLGAMPIALRYGGAHTHRFSGDWLLNQQNLMRNFITPEGKRIPGRLRTSLTAPEGHKVVVADASQVECRLGAYCCGQDDLVEDFRQGIDVYSKFGGDNIYHKPLSKKDTPAERYVSKTAVLQLGYQSGGAKFNSAVKGKSKAELGYVVDIGLAESTNIVYAYRRKMDKISGQWQTFQDFIPYLAAGGYSMQFGPCILGDQEIVGPLGSDGRALKLYYHNLQQVVTQEGRSQWEFEYAGKHKYLYGGKVLENIIQFLARNLIMEAAHRVFVRTGFRWVLQVHDELVYIIPDRYVEWFRVILAEEMRRAPTWAPDIPLGCDTGAGMNYGEAK